MTGRPFDALDRAARWRVLSWTAARILLTVAILVLIYAVAPVGDTSGSAIVRLIVELVAFAVLVAWQVRQILNAPYPGLRALEAIVLSVAVLLLVFAFTYLAMSDAAASNFTQPLDRIAAIYFAVTVLSTVGFGDIAPVSGAARLVVTLQIIMNLVLLAGGLRLLLGAARAGRDRRTATAPPERPK